MPGHKCCVRNCNGTKDLSAIPGGKIDDTRRKVWLTHCRKNSSLLKQGRVCRKHFSPTQMVEANGKLYLKPDAVPDQNLPGSNMVNRCCVKTCKQHFDYKPQHKQGAKWKLHRMPKAGDSRRQAWLHALGLPSADKTLYVCSMHFVDSDYTPTRFLQPEAVPSKNLGIPLSADEARQAPGAGPSAAEPATPVTSTLPAPETSATSPASSAEPVTPSPAGPSAALDHPATAVASTLPVPETTATSPAPLVSTPHGHQLRAGKRRWSGSSADERPSEMSTSDGQRERDIQPSTEEETVEESVSDGDVDDSDGDREGGGDCRRLPVRTAVLTEPCLDGLLELARVRCHCGQTCPPTVQRVRMAFNVEWTCSTCGPRWAWTSVSTDLTAHRQVGAARTTR